MKKIDEILRWLNNRAPDNGVIQAKTELRKLVLSSLPKEKKVSILGNPELGYPATHEEIENTGYNQALKEAKENLKEVFGG